jgi:membrane protein implicated in regulation of membrane protease activity
MVTLGFYDEWFWLVFIIIGLVMVLLELIVGVDTGLDLVFLGSAFILGGLITWPFHLWVLTLIITCVICAVYIALGRRYIHRWASGKKTKTNVDAIIGKKGFVIKSIAKNVDGRVKVGNEEWKGRAEEDLKEGEEIVVTAVTGVTLIVEKSKGGQ